MAKYGQSASDSVASAMRRRKKGTLRSGSSGQRVTSRQQAIAIGLSEAREKGAKLPNEPSASRRSASRSQAPRRKSTSRRRSK